MKELAILLKDPEFSFFNLVRIRLQENQLYSFNEFIPPMC